VPRRLVITNGDWTTRHEMGEASIVVGRDPNCDLFFVNQKLSRRHARFEPGPDGVRLVDLGSRNGVWVNERKIQNHLLAAGDSIRLGGLRIVFEEEDVEPTVDLRRTDSTVTFDSDAVGAEGGTATVIPEGQDPPESEGTIPPKETDSESPDGTVVLPGGTPASGDDERTVVLRGSDSTADSAGDATVVLNTEEKPGASTRILAPSSPTEEHADDEPLLIPEPETLADRLRRRVAALSPSTELSAALFTLSLVFGGLLAWIARSTPPAAGILFGLVLAAIWARLGTLLARHLLVGPIATRDAQAREDDGEGPADREDTT